MRKLKKYVPQDDFDPPKQVDLNRNTGVLIRQSDHKADEDHVFSRESQLKLIAYARRLRNETTDAHIRTYDEGAGVSGQKRIDQRAELNRLYNDIKNGDIGSLVVVHEDRLFRDEYYTNDTTFIQLLAQNDVLLFVRIDHRRYDCTKHSDRNALLEKMVASRNYLDDHVIGRMNGNQRAKALQGLFDGRNLPMGYVTQGKKKQQMLLIYEPWARVVRWMFERLQELDNFAMLCREIQAMPYLFPDPSAEDLMRYIFKMRMTKVPGGFKPTSVESIKYMMTNPTYMGAWVYDDAIVQENNHPAIVERELFLWAYHKLTGRTLEGEWLEGREHTRTRSGSAPAVLKHIIRSPQGVIYATFPAEPIYRCEVLTTDTAHDGSFRRKMRFGVAVNILDEIFLARLKELATGDLHVSGHIQTSINDLQAHHVETLVSIEEHLAHVRLEIEKTVAFLYDQILALSPTEKVKYSAKLEGLRTREQELLAVQEQSEPVALQSDLDQLGEVLANIPARLSSCTLQQKQKLARLVTTGVTIEELSPHWLRLTVVWRGPLADRPDVCLIWCSRGRKGDPWTPKEDEYIQANYATSDKWDMLEELPSRSWNMIYKRANGFGIRRAVVSDDDVPFTVTIEDLAVIPDPELSMEIVTEASRRRARNEFQAYAIWLFSAGLEAVSDEIASMGATNSEWVGRFSAPLSNGAGASGRSRPRARHARWSH